MPRRELQDGHGYYLISYTEYGAERRDDPDGLMSDVITKAVASGDYTDVLISSHGWKGDVPAAADQYDRWFGALLAVTHDMNGVTQRRSNFKPLLVGLHWPSLPFGDEELGGGSFGPVKGAFPDIVEVYAQRLGDTPEVRAQLEIIADAARKQAGVLMLPDEVAEAYRALDAELGLGSGDLDAPPDADRNGFDPDAAFASARNAPFGGFSLGGLLAPLRQLSYWTMKKRARMVGEGGFHELVSRLMEAHSADAVEPPRFHLMGHSFGCIVVTSTICGPGARGHLPRKVDSLLLVQGAVSLWAYCPAIELANNKPGYFAPLIANGHVSGPVVVTHSSFDTAVGRIYPIASKLRGSADFAPAKLPKFGAIGAFGAQGLAVDVMVNSGPLKAVDQTYDLAKGKLHNFDGSNFICHGGGFSGAHNDIDGPEVAHLWWEAMRSAE